MHPAYEENINVGENDVGALNLVKKVELLSEKQTMFADISRHLKEHILARVRHVRTSISMFEH